jgi:hypothetical protein
VTISPTSSTKALYLAALSRAADAVTTADVVDTAVGLAIATGWTPADITAVTPRRAAKELEAMARAGQVLRAGSARVDGTDRPVWCLPSPAAHEVPPPPRQVRQSGELESLTRSQRMALFDVMDSLLFEQRSQRMALSAFLAQQEAEFGAILERARQRLVGAGIDLGESE